MTKKYKDKFIQFSTALKHLQDAEKLVCVISDEISHVVLLSGEVLGEDTLDKIQEIGKSFGFQTITNGLSVMYRNPKPSFHID
jgi:hypothetical protein